MSYDPIDASQFCSFTVSVPEDDWISAVYIINQKAEVLLDVSYASYSETGYRDATDNIIVCTPGDVLTISVTVEAGSAGWDQALSWGHTILSEDLEKVADLFLSDGCPWTHTFDWTVPEAPGTHMISFWEHYGNFDDGCGGFNYAERQDYTLVIIATADTECTWTDYAPVGTAVIPVAAPTKDVFIVILKHEGKEDFELPVSTILIRLRDISASYIRVTVPDPLSYTTDILDRINGRMHIYGGMETIASGRLLEELIYANIQNVYFTRSDTRNLLTLAGTRFRTYSSPKSVSLNNIFSLRVDDEGRYNVRCALDHFVRPQDTVALSGGESFTVKFIAANIQHDNAWMDVEGE